MAETSSNDWTDLFGNPAQPNSALSLQLIEKAGEPFLMLPMASDLAATALAIYPAQSVFARLAKKLLGAALRARFPLGLSRATVPLALGDPFPRFLAGLIDNNSNRFPALAMLAGNPHAPGRRFIVLLFGKDGDPAIVVKAGMTEAAKILIRSESSFLQSAPPGVSGFPVIRGSFASDTIEAFALDYISGNSPKGENRATIGKLLTTWLIPGLKIGIHETAAWQALGKVCSAHPIFNHLAAKLGEIHFQPTVYHGDFTPWNIKVSLVTGDWTVLDWERGDRTGIPGWDWFHYLIQSNILVEKRSARKVLNQLENLLYDPVFKLYTETAAIAGHEKNLALAYVLYCVTVLRPGEGIQIATELLRLMAGNLS